MFAGLDASASGLTAERLRLDLIAANLANVDTVQGPGGQPYRREMPVFATMPEGGVAVVGIVQDQAPFIVRQATGDQQAGANGATQLPNVDVVAEMVDMLAATRAYQANATALDAVKQTDQSAFNIGRA